MTIMIHRYLLFMIIVLWSSGSRMSAGGEPKLPPSEKFHLYLLIGQSNMAGRGPLETPPPPAPQQVLKLSKNNEWEQAVEPLHFDNPNIVGAGLGLTFAESMAQKDPDITIGLIPCAVGGTPLSRWQQGGDLYNQAIKRARRGMKDGTLKGILWHQGEQDAIEEKLSSSYSARLTGMVQALREEFNAPDIPFVAGELGEFLPDTWNGKPNYWRVINQQLHQAQKQIPHSAVVSSSGLKPKNDQVHFDTPALREFGRRYAAAMQKLQTP